MMNNDNLVDALEDERDLCRNDGANDIADLLSRAIARIESDAVRIADLENRLWQIYVEANETAKDWLDLPPAETEGYDFAAFIRNMASKKADDDAT
jgi:hypothetical protein